MIELDAPAKVNLSLTVGPARADGFHPVESVVQTISLADTLRIEPADTDRLTVEGPDAVPRTADNLVVRALAAVRARVPVPALHLHLTKRIPAEAGLGGGSSDAAALLRGVASLLDLDLDLVDVAGGVGSDVAALVVGGTVRVGGRGEQVESLPSVAGVRWLAVTPPFGLATADVYRRWDELGGPTGPSPDWPRTRAVVGGVGNDLHPAAVDLAPGLARWLAALADVAGRPALVSGSGSTCFVEVDEPLADVARGHGLLGTARLIADVEPVGPAPLSK